MKSLDCGAPLIRDWCPRNCPCCGVFYVILRSPRIECAARRDQRICGSLEFFTLSPERVARNDGTRGAEVLEPSNRLSSQRLKYDSKRRRNSSLRRSGSVSVRPRQLCAACASQPQGQRWKCFSPHAGHKSETPPVTARGCDGVTRGACRTNSGASTFGTQITSFGGSPSGTRLSSSSPATQADK